MLTGQKFGWFPVRLRTNPNATVRLTSVQSVEQGVFSAADADLATVSQIKSATQPEQKALPPSEMMRVGLLLPLSGKSAKLGEALRNAAMMSLFDISSGRLVLQFYDTEGTAEGARNASELAISQGVELIIGPIFSEEVRAIRENTHSADIGVITFSSHPSNLGDGIYTISTLTSQQVEHIIGYACDKGYKRFAILSQDNAMGDIVAMAAKSAADRCGATITKAGFYYSKTDNLQPTVQQVMPRLVEEMQKEKDEEIERLEKARADVLAGLPVKMKNEETGMEEERMMTMEELTATIETLKNTEIVRDPFHFIFERPRIDNDAVPDNRQFAAHNPRRQQAQFIRRPVYNQSMPRIVPALETNDNIRFFGHPVHDFAFAFVSPAGSYYCFYHIKYSSHMFNKDWLINSA